AFGNQDVQFEELIDRLAITRDPSRNPLFDVSMVVQNFGRPMGGDAPPLSAEELLRMQYQVRTSKVDMTFFIYEYGEDIYITIEYYTGIFNPQTIQRLASHFTNILASVIAEPSRSLEDIEVISAEEKQRLLYEFNGEEVVFPHDRTIHQLFEERVSLTPDAVAFVGLENDGGNDEVNYGVGEERTPVRHVHSLSYRQLNEKADRLAAYLCYEAGIQSEERVGILVSGALNWPVSILGVLKAGGAYVPLDPSLPVERLKYMINDAFVSVVVSGKRHIKTLNRLQWDCPCFHGYLCLDSENVHEEVEELRKRALEIVESKIEGSYLFDRVWKVFVHECGVESLSVDGI
ncbi:MAG: AMP-binding protein, partial [bacterium]|nr:AMP-binding protein [bacterium]